MPLVYEEAITLPNSSNIQPPSQIWRTQQSTTERTQYYLEIYDSPWTIIWKIVTREWSNTEIARIHLWSVEELKDMKAYYPIRSDVIEWYQRQGIWSFLYDMMIQYLWDHDLLLLSGSLNNASKGLWEWLRRQGRVSDRKVYMGYKYAMEALPKDL